MLKDLRVHTTLPATDLERARAFYRDTLGLDATEEQPGGLLYHCKDSTFVLYPGAHAGTGQHTQMGFTTDDIEAEVAQLTGRGVTFESYPDMPGFDPASRIATIGPSRAAWFRDSEGNMLGLIQFGADQAP